MRLPHFLKHRWDLVLSLLCLQALVVAGAFLWGYASHAGHTPPGKTIARLDAARKAWLSEWKQSRQSARDELPLHERWGYYHPRTEPESGVVLSHPGQCSPGLTAFSEGADIVRLIDLEGREVHRWEKDFSEIWPDPRHLIRHASPELSYIRFSRPMPNGDLFVGYEGINQSPYGGGFAKLDKDSRLLWKLDRSAHHDFDIAPDGRIFVLTHRYQSDPILIEDYVTILSPRGEVLEDIKIYDALRNGPYAHLLQEKPFDDYLHNNNLDILPPEMADEYPRFEPGDLLLSMRSINTICVLHPATRSVVWALTGLASRQHDPDFIGRNRIALFDNKGLKVDGKKYSRILEWDIGENRIVWQYSDPPRFRSIIYGSQQQLPNGNYLITESNQGTLLEVNRAGETVWQYVSVEQQADSISSVHWGRRFEPGYFTFLDR